MQRLRLHKVVKVCNKNFFQLPVMPGLNIYCQQGELNSVQGHQRPSLCQMFFKRLKPVVKSFECVHAQPSVTVTT